MTHSLDGKAVTLSQHTDYPWSGDVRVTVDENRAGCFTLKLRIPGWVRGEVVPSDLYTFADGRKTGYAVSLNGETLEGELQNGYFCITRDWKAGDEVALSLEMAPRFVRAHEAVEADRGRLAVECGPLVYCAEWPDNAQDVLQAAVSADDALSEAFRPELLGGIRVIRDGELTLIPYYAWNHRGPGKMEVWLYEK